MDELSEDLMQRSIEKYQNQSLTTQTSNEISLYQGELTRVGFIKAVELLEGAFPKMPANLINALKERFKANGFCDERMLDAIGYVIDTYEGWDKLPNIANFIQYDKKAKIYTHQELMKIHADAYRPGARYDPIAEEYTAIDHNGKRMLIKNEHFNSTRFKKWEKK